MVTGTGTGQDPAQLRLAHHHFAAEMLRVRNVLLVAGTLWLVLGTTLDLIAFQTLGRGSIWVVLGCRWAATAYHVFFITLLFRDPLPSERLTVFLGAFIFPLSAAALTVMSSRVGGLTSAYQATLIVILTAQVLALPQHWKQGLPVALATALMFPVGMVVLSRVDPVIRADLASRPALTWFIIFNVSVGAAVVLVVWGGHIIWSLRQSAFESKSIGRYRLLRRIGMGGMGEVWRARDKAMRRDVALKILSKDHGRSPAGVARFEREIQATTELTHPNTVRILDWGITHDGVWYYAMELLDGLDLGTLVKREGPLPVALVVKLGAEAARALAEAHGKGIVHRDIKPGNLFVVSLAGQVDYIKVLDFGVARVADEDSQLTQAGAVMGTPGFIAPEVLGGVPAGPAADIFGLAATLGFALSGVSPSGGRLPLGLKLPAPLEEILMRALDPDPARRPASALQLATELGATGLAATVTSFRMAAGPQIALAPTVNERPDTATPPEAPVARGRGTPTPG